jgi:hypothetical protein
MLMRKIGIAAVVVVFWTSGLASAQIVVSVPDKVVPETATTASLTITATFQQNPVPYDMGGFNLKLNMTGDAGCVFTGASAGSPYALGVGDNWDAGSIISAGRTIEEITDARDNDAYLVDASAGDVVLNLVVLDVAFSGISIGDQFTIHFDAASTNDTALFEYSGNYHAPVWDGGTITVPEPASMTLLALGGLLALRRKRK